MIKTKLAYLNIIYLIFLFGYIFSKGFYSMFGSIILTLLLLIFIGYIIKKDYLNLFLGKLPRINYIKSKKWILCISLLLSLFLYGGMYQQIGTLYLLSHLILIFCFLLAVFSNKPLNYFYLFLIAYVLLGIFMLVSSPKPHIDVFFMFKESAHEFLKGKNPYDMIYTPVYGEKIDYYIYLPGLILLTTPFVYIFNDPRYLFLFMQLLTSFILYWKFKSIYSIIFLFNPIGLFILEQSWSDSLVILLIIISTCLILSKRFLIGSIVFGIIFSIKQYAAFLLPLLWVLLNGKIKYILYAFITTFMLVIPFIIWNPNKFYYGAISMLPKLGFRPWGLTFNSFIYNIFGFYISNLYSMIFWIILFYITFLWKRNIIKWTGFNCIFRMFIFIFGFFFVNKWAFANYFYFLSSLLLFSIVLAEKEKIK